MIKKSLFFTTLLIAACNYWCSAQIAIFDTITGSSFTNSGWSVESSDGQDGGQFAIAFTPIGPIGTEYRLSSIEAVTTLEVGENSIGARLYSDDGGRPKLGLSNFADPIEQFSPVGLSTTRSVISANSIENPTLIAGTTYWFSLYTTGTNTKITWNFDPANKANLIQRFGEVAGWNAPFVTNAGGFRINAGVIPEPSTYALMIGAGCLAFVAWRRRQTVRGNE